MSTLDDVLSVARLLRGFTKPWFISGGWAIDLYLGAVTRPHEDLETGIFRDDQGALRDHLTGWELCKAVQGPDGGEWVPWQPHERLELPVHQVLARREGGEPREIEFFLNEVADGVWWFRRNQEITRPADSIVVQTAAGIPCVAPEIQLLYKARECRPKDEHDFQQVCGHLDAARRAWLRAALRVAHPDSPWIAVLE